MMIMTINSEAATITAMALFLVGFALGACLGYNTGAQRTLEENMIEKDSIVVAKDSTCHTDTVNVNMDLVRDYVVLRLLIKGL